eukprot:7896934-Karenia_brevis.AAC.1
MHAAFEERLDQEGNELHHDIELASHGKDWHEMKAAITEWHRALSRELNSCKVTKDADSMDSIDQALQKQQKCMLPLRSGWTKRAMSCIMTLSLLLTERIGMR